MLRAGITTCCRKCTTTFIDCCCALRHGAYSSSCECRQIPIALLFVSKQMKTDSIHVLLSHNAFQFLQDPIETISFLRTFPQETLKYIRRIKFYFSEDEINNWEKRGYKDKIAQLALFVGDNFEISKLFIAVTLETFDIGGYAEDDNDLRLIYDIYRDTTRVLRQLSALEDAQFGLGWFKYLEPIMRRAVLGRKITMGSSEDKYSHREGDPPAYCRLPEWYKRGDFTRS